MVESLKIPEVFVGDKVLGVGSFAEVLEGKWRGTVCAVKRLHRITVTELHSIVVDKFMNECQMWSRLRHPNIVLFLGVIQSPEDVLPSLVLEKMSTNLTKFIEDRNRRDLQLNQKSYILQQVSHALLYIHSQSPPLLHRDLTPNNVLLDECSLKAKLTDLDSLEWVPIIARHLVDLFYQQLPVLLHSCLRKRNIGTQFTI